MSEPDSDLRAADVELPIKRTTGETLEERMTGNAYNNILPARYLRKDADGNITEDPEELFERIAKNIALAEAAFEADKQGVEVQVSPDQLKPKHPRRDELAAEVFGEGVTVEDDVTTRLTPENVNKFAYDTIVPALPEEVRAEVASIRDEFQDLMESLSFTPNSPTIMNAGDELQQLSACFVMSPNDDLSDIHETAKKAAEVFQCLTADTRVCTESDGLVNIDEVEPGDRIRQGSGGTYRYRKVTETHAYHDAPTTRVRTEPGIELTGTPNHRLLVEDEWRYLDEIEPGDTVAIELGWVPIETDAVELTTVSTGARWEDQRTVSNEAIVELHAEGLNDYEIADRLGASSSTVQYRRANELDLPPNGTGGRPKGRSFHEDTFFELHEGGHTDGEIAEQLDVSSGVVRSYRVANDLEPNGQPVKSVSQPATLTEDLAELVGLWIGDGSKHQDGIRFHLERDELVERVDRLSRRLFDTGADWTWAEGCYEVTINSHEIKRFWLENFGDAKPEAAEARVPAPVAAGDQGTVAAFLRGLFSADGTLNKSLYPTLYSASEGLVDDVQQLLLGIGIPATKWSWDNDDRDYFTVRATDGVGLTRFAELVGFADERTNEMVGRLDEVDVGSTTCGDVAGWRWQVEVERVEHAERNTVYDVTVENMPEYVANSVVSHNSGGGVGYGFWQLRPYGDSVGSTGGIASGPITFMRTYDQLCETIAQGGTRRGAQMAVMRVSHPDVIEFIHAKNKDVSLAHCLRLNDPDDYTYTSFNEALEEARELIDEEGRVPKHLRNAVEGHLSNFNISVGVTDGFMEALQNDEAYTFTNPRTGDAHIATEETKEMYDRYDLGEYVEVGTELSLPASVLWERIISGAHQNGEPGVIYLERVNKEHSFDVAEHEDHRMLATNPCVTAEMEVQLADGTTRQMGELAERGGEVAVKTLDEGEVVERPATAFRTRDDAPILRLETDSGISLRLTPDHRVRTANGKWVEAQKLASGDDIVCLDRLLATPAGTVQDTMTETVASIELDGQDPVYDLHVEGTHNFFASGQGEGSINVHNCGEQPLEEFEACNLGHINLSTLAAQETPDWRVWSEQHADEYDDIEAAIDAFLADAIDWEEFDYRIEMGTRFLENVVTMSDFPVEEISETVRRMRKIGLGIMGLAQLYIQLGIEYGSDPGNEVARQLMTHINHGSKWASHELAEERGPFGEWEQSKYADPVQYREWFEHQTGLDADEWADGFPIRNHNCTTIAPTGTTSMLANTSGGCEPIPNVAYYKNVSDDVQGEEMLVEFDDYFLRVLEANDIDVDTVKQEAEYQMANNEYAGIEGLATVPDEIGELFVVTSDLSGLEHASVQCACQEGVDSAISKTINAPHNATLEDTKAAFEYIYDHGGKGVTYYRDGTRSKQVITTRAKNADFADEAEDDPVAILEYIQELFGGLDAFLEDEAIQDALEDELILGEPTTELDEQGRYADKRSRPDALRGISQRIETGYGKVYVTINEDPETGEPFELFANIGHSGGFTNSFTEALAKVISTALRSRVDPYELVDELCGTRSPKVAWDKGEQIQSIPDAIGTALRRYMDDDIDRPYPDQKTLEETAEPAEASTQHTAQSDGGATTGTTGNGTGGPTESGRDAAQELIDAGESPECPDCGGFSLYFMEGCKTCGSCGWSEC